LAAFVCLLLHLYQGEAEGGMIELAAVGSPPPQQGISFVIRFYSRKIIFLFFLLYYFQFSYKKSKVITTSYFTLVIVAS